jgi:hypothetical protein
VGEKGNILGNKICFGCGKAPASNRAINAGLQGGFLVTEYHPFCDSCWKALTRHRWHPLRWMFPLIWGLLFVFTQVSWILVTDLEYTIYVTIFGILIAAVASIVLSSVFTWQWFNYVLYRYCHTRKWNSKAFPIDADECEIH